MKFASPPLFLTHFSVDEKNKQAIKISVKNVGFFFNNILFLLLEMLKER